MKGEGIMMKKNKWMVFLVFVLAFGLIGVGLGGSSSFAADKKWKGPSDTKLFKYHPGGFNEAAKDYYRPEGFPRYPKRVKFIGLLKGSWYEMGVQYGKRCPKLILTEFDGMLPTIRWDAAPYDHLKSDLARYDEQASYYAPEMLEFIRGIADGAARELDKSPYAGYFTNYQQVFLISCHSSLTFRHPPPEAHEPGVWAATTLTEMASIPSTTMFSEGCSAFALAGTEGGAKEENAYSTQNRDIPFFPRAYEVAYVAEADDPDANTFWALSSAGMIMANYAVNNKGLAIGHLSGGSRYEKDCDFGVPWPFRMLHAVAYTDNRDDAIEMMTLGTPEYRAATDRSTLLRDGDSNTIVADKDSCGVLETTAHWYAVRYPGDMDEIGNYIVSTNHFCVDAGSYDEDNVWHDGLGMTRFGDAASYSSSGFRFSTLMQLIKYNFGEIDDALAQEFMTSHFYINTDGERVDNIWDEIYGWIPTQYGPGSPVICRHSGGYPEKNTGSTQDSKVSNLTENIVYWTMGRPCDWKGPWSRVEFKP